MQVFCQETLGEKTTLLDPSLDGKIILKRYECKWDVWGLNVLIQLRVGTGDLSLM
jgi:hypothetical protein